MTATTDPDANEVEMIRLPCGHLTAPPTRLVTTVDCHCGRRWLLTRTLTELTAREQPAHQATA